MPHKKSVLHWTPDPIGEAIKTLESLGVDSSKIKSDRDVDSCADKLKSAAACAYPGEVVFFAGTHVTDDAEAVVSEIRQGRYPEWGVGLCKGLWVTDAPDLFLGMNVRRWSFMEDLNKSQDRQLRSELIEKLHRDRAGKYITKNELEFGLRLIEDWGKTGRWDPVRELAHQPFNINIPDLAEKKGIAYPHQAQFLRVYFTGKYASLDGESFEAARWLAQETLGISAEMLDSEDICRVLKEYGWDGVFKPMGVSDPYVNIWNLDKVKLGDMTRLTGPSLGDSGANVWIPGSRFEANVSKDQRVADIVDRNLKKRFFYLLREDIWDLLSVVNGLLAGDVGEAGRFKAELVGVLPQVVDQEEGVRLTLLRSEDLEELTALLDSVLSSMVIF